MNKMYSLNESISKGSYGRVWRVTRGGEEFALKEFILGGRKDNIIGAVHLKEADLLRRSQHPFILTAVEITYGCPYIEKPRPLAAGRLDVVHVIMPICEQSLYEFLRHQECDVPTLKRFAVQIAHALEYLHRHNICYRDVKSPNVLVADGERTPNLIVRNAILCDLGMCKPLIDRQTNSEHVGTMAYKAPEVMMSIGKYSYPIDVWGYGSLIFEMFNDSLPFERQRDTDRDSKRVPQNIQTSEILIKLFMNRGSPTRDLFNRLTGGGMSNIVSFERISKWSRKKISSLFRRNHYHMRHFDDGLVEPAEEILHIEPDEETEKITFVKTGLPNFGKLSDFEDLLEHLLQVDPILRPTMTEVLKHPFFKDSPIPFVEAKPIERHRLLKIEDSGRREKGFKVFKEISKTFSNQASEAWRIIFLGLDIYDRCLIRLVELDETCDEVLLAYCSCYIACKYFMDEDTPALAFIFPKHSFPQMDIIDTEERILVSLLDWQIYRPTVFDILNDASYNMKLLKVLMETDKVYGCRIDSIAKSFLGVVRK